MRSYCLDLRYCVRGERETKALTPLLSSKERIDLRLAIQKEMSVLVTGRLPRVIGTLCKMKPADEYQAFQGRIKSGLEDYGNWRLHKDELWAAKSTPERRPLQALFAGCKKPQTSKVVRRCCIKQILDVQDQYRETKKLSKGGSDRDDAIGGDYFGHDFEEVDSFEDDLEVLERLLNQMNDKQLDLHLQIGCTDHDVDCRTGKSEFWWMQ